MHAPQYNPISSGFPLCYHRIPVKKASNTMPEKVIPIRPAQGLLAAAGNSKPARFGGGAFADTMGRHLRDLRISVTDRCNFRCVYCMPRDVFDENYKFLP